MSEAIKVAIWPDGTWVSLEESRDFGETLRSKSDDYEVVDVTEWDGDGSPAAKYFR